MIFLAQKVQPASGASDPNVLFNYSLFSLHIHHCLVWIGHQQDTNRMQRTLSGASLPHIQDFRLSHPGHDLIQLLPSGRHDRALCCTPKQPEQLLHTGRHSEEQLNQSYSVNI